MSGFTWRRSHLSMSVHWSSWILKWIGHFLLSREKKERTREQERTTKSRTTIQNRVRTKNQFIGWCLICMYVYIFPFLSFSLSSSMLAHDIQEDARKVRERGRERERENERREGKLILIGSIEKKKSQYKVKIQSISTKLSFQLLTGVSAFFLFLLAIHRQKLLTRERERNWKVGKVISAKINTTKRRTRQLMGKRNDASLAVRLLTGRSNSKCVKLNTCVDLIGHCLKIYLLNDMSLIVWEKKRRQWRASENKKSEEEEEEEDSEYDRPRQSIGKCRRCFVYSRSLC